MYYIVQENLFKEDNFNILIDILEKKKLGYEIIKWRPFSDEIDFKTDRKDVLCFGGVSLTKAAQKYGWKPGVFYNGDHDMEEYMKHYGIYMLNHEGFCINYGDPLPESISEFFFARPTRDTKVFSGGIFSRKEWNNWVNLPRAEGVDLNVDENTRIFICNEKHYIATEIRCWIVDGKVITASQYKLGKLVIKKNLDNNQEAIDFAQRMVDIHCPSRAFVLDICLYQGEYKIVEINCINSAGFYDANMHKLIEAFESMKF